MAEPKEVIMILKVDLQCCKCYKKVKKVLCKFPQIRDQVYDEKANKVIIKVFCCNPEKLRDKLCCKGGGSIKSIEIVEPPPPKKPEKPEKKPEKPPEEKPKPPPAQEKPPEEKPKPPPAQEKPPEEKPKPPPEKPTKPETAKPVPKPAPPPPTPAPLPADPAPPPPQPPPPAPPAPPPPAPPPVMPPVPVWPQPPCGPPIGLCCGDCYHGHTGGPCYEMGYRPVYDSWGGGYTRCDYFNEENSQGCSIM